MAARDVSGGGPAYDVNGGTEGGDLRSSDEVGILCGFWRFLRALLKCGNNAKMEIAVLTEMAY